MLIKTKNYQLPKDVYVKIAMKGLLKKEWWYAFGPLVLAVGGCLWIFSWWWISASLVIAVGYLLFWWIQFKGLTQLEQGKMLFEKMSYEITSQQILMKINTTQGMPIRWDMIKRATVSDDAFVLFLSKAQLIHLPFKLFANDNQTKFVKSVLKNKNLI